MKIKVILRVILAAILASSSGCVLLMEDVVNHASRGTITYTNAELKCAETVPYDVAYDATLAGINDMSYVITDNQKNTLTVKISARSIKDTKIYIMLTKQSAKVTEFKIRVGNFGDEIQSRLIFDKIKGHVSKN